MRAATLSIGDELALGQIDDTNARWIATTLATEGVFRGEHRTVGDTLDDIAEAITVLASRYELLVLTGGLGPTQDDLTRDALNQACDGGAPLVEDEDARASLDRWFRGRGRSMPTSNLVQALRPRSARCIPNPNGTAPGLVAHVGQSIVFCLPGPPKEMCPMFDAAVRPWVREHAGAIAMPTIAVHAFGAGESTLAERLGPRMRRDAMPTVGTTASQSIVTARIRAQGERSHAHALAESMACEVEALWQPYAYGRDGTSLAEATLAVLRSRGESVAVAESCTGGLIGAMLTNVAGASDVVLGGFIVYSNEMKVREVGVDRSTLAAHGAVSEPIARQLATGARERTRATWAIGVTGIAGPDGGSAAKPVGTVFIALAGPAGELVRRCQFPGDRETVRDRSAKLALQWLRCASLGQPLVPLLWAFADPPPAERETSRSAPH